MKVCRDVIILSGDTFLTIFAEYFRSRRGDEIVSVLCGAGMKKACDAFGFSLMIGSRFSWRFCIKDVGMVKQKQNVHTLVCGNRMRSAMCSPQNLSCCT